MCAVFEHPETGVDAVGLKIDRIGRLGVRLDGQYAGTTAGREDDEFPEPWTEAKPKLGVAGQVGQSGDAAFTVEDQARQDIIELEPFHGLAGPEIESRIDLSNFAGGQKIFENPEAGTPGK